MHLSPEEIAAAEACGVSFLPASDAQVQRLAMQRKVFYRAGAPILATRGDGLFETAGTLQQLIDEGRQQQRDLSQWLDAAEPSATPVPEALPEAAPEPVVPASLPEPVAPLAAPEPVAARFAPEPAAVEPAAPPPKRPRQKRRRPDMPVPNTPVSEPDEPAQVVAEPLAEAELPQDSEAEMADAEVVHLPPALPRSPGRSAARAPAAVEAPGQDRGKRWLMAGATRRGRAGKHWSTRQR